MPDRAIRCGDLLQEMVDKYGLETLASDIGIDKAALSRFKNGEGALKLVNIERLMNHGDMIMISKADYQGLWKTITFLNDHIKRLLSW